METYSSILAWRTPWTEDPGGLQFMGSQITADGDCSHEIKRRLLLGRKVMINLAAAAAAAKSLQSCPTLCDPMDYTVHGIL